MPGKILKKPEDYTPGYIGGSLVNFLPADNNMFFLRHEGQWDYLRDEWGKAVTFTTEKVMEARKLYLNTPERFRQ